MKRLLAVGLLLLSFGCGRRHPNIVLITFDSTRADHLGYATGRQGLTPNLDEVAAKGAWFSTCITAAPLTAPSHATILTGQYPYHHGVRNNGAFVLQANVKTIAQRLHAAGYQTKAVVSAGELSRRTGLDRGFDSYDDDFALAKGGSTHLQQNGDSTASKAVHWFNFLRKKAVPFFLWVQFDDPHGGNEPPQEDAALFPDDPYSAEIHFADRQLGKLIDTIKANDLWDDTVFIFVADQGESLGEHGEMTHGVFLYDSTTRVPLLLAGREIDPGRIDSLVRTADIAPTILDLAGISSASARLDGESLLPLIRGDSEKARVAYSESLAPRLDFGWSELRSERTLTTRVVAAPRPEVYDEKSDPNERTNLIATEPPAGDARRLLEDLERIGDGDPLFRGTAAGEHLPDPKDRIGVVAQSGEVGKLLAAHKYQAAADGLRRLLATDPNNPVILAQLGDVCLFLGQREDALRLYWQALATEPGQLQASIGAVRLLRKQGRFAEAEPLAHKLVDAHPREASSWIALGELLVDMGRFPDGEAAFRKATQIDPKSTIAIASLGNALSREGKQSEALSLLEKERKENPQNQDIVYNLGLVYDTIGKRDEAEAAYRQSVAIDPGHSMSWNNLGSVLDREGKRSEAIDDVRRAHGLDPLNTEATYNLGALLLVSGHPADALPLLEQAARERPGFLQGQIELAAALQAVGSNGEAIEVLRRLSASQPAALLRIAMIEWQEGKLQAARRDLEAAEARGGAPIEALIRKTPSLSRIAQNR